jgi:hypothetical protein
MTQRIFFPKAVPVDCGSLSKNYSTVWQGFLRTLLQKELQRFAKNKQNKGTDFRGTINLKGKKIKRQ